MPDALTEAARWRRVQALSDALDGVDECAWAARLGTLEADASLRAETMSLRAAMRDDAAFTAPAERAPLVAAHPDTIGGVRILSRLGSGGSGEVFRGVRTAGGTEQPVAVKRFHVHRATATDLDRFAREQRMLATLTHPDIVRFIDAGVAIDGRPFLVMELAQGDPITAWCDQRRLPLTARLTLFLAVCDAVQSAHRRLIVHLDLKPANILVTTDGRPKLLDFGTAKLTGPDLGLTATEPLTLQYASPERLRGEAVSVACDVYSLGLILYELASGGWPFRRHESLVGIAERAAGAVAALSLPRSVTEDAAARRATTLDRLRGRLRGDLDAIVTRALAHEPDGRYASVSDLAEDLRRLLAGEPVRARPPGVGYRLGKFLRRHRWEAASAAVLVIGLAGAALFSAAQARDARQAAARAQAQNRFLTSVFTLAGTDVASSHAMTVRELLALADARVQPVLGSTPAIAADVEVVLAKGYLSQAAYAESRVLLERAVARAAASGDVVHEAEARATLSYVAFTQNITAEALAQARAALALWSSHAAAFAPGQAASTLQIAASVLSYVNPADASYRAYFDRCLAVAAAAPDDVALADRAECLRGRATAYMNGEARYGDAATMLQHAVTLLRTDAASASKLAMSLQLLGLAHRSQGRYADDEQAQREARDILERLLGRDSVAAIWQRAVWATSLVGAGRGDEAYREAQTALAVARRHYPERGSYLLWTPVSAAAGAACMLERHDECEALAREALATLGPTPAASDIRAHSARGMLGLALAGSSREDEARPLLLDAVAAFTAQQRPSVFLPRWRAALAAMPDGGAVNRRGGRPGQSPRRAPHIATAR